MPYPAKSMVLSSVGGFVMDFSPSNDRLGYVLVRFADLGPEAVLADNPPFDEDMMDFLGPQLGIYLSLVTGQGSREVKSGLFGPMPWSETPNHSMLAFAFFGSDPSVADPRSQEKGVLTFAVIFYQSDDLDILKARLGIDKELTTLLTSGEQLPSITQENVPTLFSQVKEKVEKSLTEGTRIYQEQAMDKVLSNPRILFMGLYSTGQDRSLIAEVIGEEEKYFKEIQEARVLNMDLIFTSFGKALKFGFYRFVTRLVITVFDDQLGGTSMSLDEFLDFSNTFTTAVPLLEEYFG